MMRIGRRNLACATVVLAWVILAAGCAPEMNPKQPSGESQTLNDVMQLTSGFARAGEGYFSPDMKWIVFQATPKGEENYQMYVARLKYWKGNSVSRFDAGMAPHIFGIGTPVRISPGKSRNTCGYFSPDGGSMIFASTAGKEVPSEKSSGYQREGGSYRWAFPAGMEIYRADGWEGAVRAADPSRGTNLAQHALTGNRAYDAECAYSPDGKWIVFSSNRTGDGELFAMRADGSDAVQLTSKPGYDGGPFFSPEGKRVVYRSDRAGNDLLQIFVADVVPDSSGKIVGLKNERQLTKDRNVNWGPYWHPDGKHIIYATSAHGHTNYELYLMRADGTRKTRITFTPGFDGLPVFSPDGKWLMWSSKRSGDGTTQVFVARFTMPEGS
jgi:TolB protein